MNGYVSLWSRALVSGIAAAMVGGCGAGGPVPPPRVPEVNADKIVVTPSATGWRVHRGPTDPESGGPATILANPGGHEFNVGTTQFPDINTTFLWRVTVKEFHSDFLVLYTNPVASGGSTITLFRIVNSDTPIRVADIVTHDEMHPMPGSLAKDPLVAIVDYPQGRSLREILFTDFDRDGVPELEENDVGKYGGFVRYYRWNGDAFRLARAEKYVEDGKGGARLVSWEDATWPR